MYILCLSRSSVHRQSQLWQHRIKVRYWTPILRPSLGVICFILIQQVIKSFLCCSNENFKCFNLSCLDDINSRQRLWCQRHVIHIRYYTIHIGYRIRINGFGRHGTSTQEFGHKDRNCVQSQDFFDLCNGQSCPNF